MNRELRITGDGSHTIYAAELDEPYHSIHGAIHESKHVFIEQGLRQTTLSSLRILEIGFGTGLNLLLTLAETNESGIEVHYHAVEKYPLVSSEYTALNFQELIRNVPEGSFMAIHQSPWDQYLNLTNTFSLFKEKADIRHMEPGTGYNLVYFDAFAPDKQPHLWSEDVFKKVCSCMNPEGLLVTYASKGSVRRTMNACGFRVEKVPGPPGKREMIRARRI
jgi:tRNA U34 5-methylaminomethyl-2-thiouridine-forming methyltransferase MnmC